jgi:hypothetical protein
MENGIVKGIRSFTDSVISGILDGFVSQKARAQIDGLYARYWRNVIITAAIHCVMIAIVFIARRFFTINTAVVFTVSLMALGLMVWAIIRFINSLRSVVKVYRWEHFDIILFVLKTVLKRRSLTEGVRAGYRAFYERYNKKSKGIIGIVHSVISWTGAMKSPEAIEDDVVRVCSFIKDYAVKLILYRAAAITVFYGVFLFVLKPYMFSQALAMNWIEVAAYPFTIVLPAIIAIIKGWV